MMVLAGGQMLFVAHSHMGVLVGSWGEGEGPGLMHGDKYPIQGDTRLTSHQCPCDKKKNIGGNPRDHVSESETWTDREEGMKDIGV